MEPSGVTFDDPEELHDLIYEVQDRPRYAQRTRERSTRAAAHPSAPADSTDAPQNAGFSFRQVFLLMFLSAVVAVLVMKLNTMENTVEVRQATTIREAHHRLPKAKVQNGPKKQEKSEASKSTVWKTKRRKDDDTQQPKSTEERSAKVDAGTGETATDQADTHEHSYIGFHSPSLENMYGPNHYYKPKGVGFQHRPTGGNHPIYVMESAPSSSVDVYYSFDDDPETSPYTDLRLKMTDEERKIEQSEWSEMLEGIREKYGAWDFSDEYASKNKKPRPVVDWEGFEDYKRSTLGEISSGDFPKDSWQTDDTYVTNFISEAQALVKRVQTAIRDEYGLSEDQVKVSILPTTDDRAPQGGKNGSGEGIAWMYQSAFDALVKKLLNAMITNDHFFMVLGGHSAAAGHGNNFHQNYMGEFQHIMEPVFDRLGMVLVASNRAQGGMGTVQTALAGSGIYGEKDFMLWDSSMTEKNAQLQDVFMRQMILSGHRVPILFDLGGGKGSMDAVYQEGGAHVGGVTNGSINPAYKSVEGELPKYNAVCWTDRSDVTPPVQQNPGFGGQASWHPGNLTHQYTARKLSLLFLHAMTEALNRWKEAVETEGSPLGAKYWHLYEEEEKIRDAFKRADVDKTGCGEILNFASRVCRSPMRGAGEWTPRANLDRSSIRGIAKPAPNGYLPKHFLEEEEGVYVGKEPKIPSQRVPKGEVNVAAVARSLPKVERSRRVLGMRKLRYRSGHVILSSNSTAQLRHRRLDDSKVIPGEGWSVTLGKQGFCDGTLNSQCGRRKSEQCLMSDHNDGRGTMMGDGLSGWLVLQLKDITEGLFLARMEPWQQYYSNPQTDGWTEVNNGRIESDKIRRRLKKPPPPLPDDFRFEVAIDGELQYSLNNTEFQAKGQTIGYNLWIACLWDDEEWAKSGKKQDVEFAMRIRGENSKRSSVMGISQVYFA